MMKVTLNIMAFIFLIISFNLNAQNQIIKGVVKDADSEEVLPGVNIILNGHEPFKGVVTDIDGVFTMEDVPVGRQSLTISFVGYKSQTMTNILVTAGKEVFLDIKMIESVEGLKEVVVSAETSKDKTINEMVMVSGRTFSPEEVNRFSGGRNDVARLATNYAGVNTADDSRNDIIVRGNSPTGLLWRIEGIPMANTNHFATLGTSGGPVSALNTNMLRTSDFISGAFPAEYGNANAAVFDVNFRNGNPDKFEFMGQMSPFNGVEFMVEGPMRKEKSASFILDYRYGMASLAATGTSAIPYYQDLSFKINFTPTRIGTFQLFGMGGMSSIDFYGDEIEENDLYSDRNVDAFVAMNLGLCGLKHVVRINKSAYIKTIVGTSFNQENYSQYNIIRDSNGVKQDRYLAGVLKDLEVRYTVSSQINKKFSSRMNMRTGMLVEVYRLNTFGEGRDPGDPDTPDENNDGIPDYFVPYRDVDEYSPLYQAYSQAEYRFTDEISATAGIHGQFLSINNDFSIEPRIGFKWQYKPKSAVTLAYGLHSQMVPLPILVDLQEVTPKVYEMTNKDLSFMKSHHFVVGYERKLGADWRLKLESYYQYLFDLPVDNYPSFYNAVNEGANFGFSGRGNLVSEGTAHNVGLEVTAEKFFSRGYYLLVTTSVFDSKYKGSDHVERNTAYNSNYVFNALGGKEWAVGKEKRNAVTFDTRFTTSGGKPYTPIDLEATKAEDGNVIHYFEDEAYSLRYEYYLRLDVKFGFRINSKKSSLSHQFYIDFQNVTNRKNTFSKEYNQKTEDIYTITQTGFFPDFMYRIQF